MKIKECFAHWDYKGNIYYACKFETNWDDLEYLHTHDYSMLMHIKSGNLFIDYHKYNGNLKSTKTSHQICVTDYYDQDKDYIFSMNQLAIVLDEKEYLKYI